MKRECDNPRCLTKIRRVTVEQIRNRVISCPTCDTLHYMDRAEALKEARLLVYEGLDNRDSTDAYTFVEALELFMELKVAETMRKEDAPQ